MHCPSCETENRAGRRFCLVCGNPLPRSCPVCGAANEGEAAFCGVCGAILDQAPSTSRDGQGIEYDPTAGLERLVPREFAERLRSTRGHVGHERRLVTMLFCDIKGSTPIAEALDPEDVLDILNGAFGRLIPPIYRHEGTVAEMRGDAILAFFGAPVGHEDDPARAVRAALDIQAGIRDYAARLRVERGIEGFSVRIGIHTGLVVVGEVGSDLRVAYTAVGDAINLAARMEQNAPPGGILISAATWHSIAEDFVTAAQPPLAVKGHVAPVDTYLVERPIPVAIGARTRRIEGVETRLVGRDAELGQLEAALAAALEGRGGPIVLVTGDPGVGKSRLVGELVRAARDRPEPPDAWMGRAMPTAIATPYGLLRDLWARRCGILDSDSAAVARERFERDVVGVFGDDASGVMRAHVLGHLLGLDYAGSPYLRGLLDDPRQVRDRARVYLTDYLRSASTRRPLIVVLEDLHWADDSSLSVLPELAEALRDRSILFLATARPALDQRRQGWAKAVSGMLRLALEPLGAAASEELVAEILRRADAVPDALRNMIVGRSEGNPFFAEELVKMLLDDGVIERSSDDGQGWRVRADRLDEVRIPPGLTGVLQARLDRLDPEERATLQRASVVGRRFWDLAVSSLAAADDHPADRTRAPGVTAASLAALERRELAFERAPSTFAACREYVFKHALVRDVAYASLLRRHRRAYHGAAADWLLATGGDRADEIAGTVGEHLELAGRGAEAARQYAQAAARAAATFANDEAIDLYGRALRLIRELPLETRDVELSAHLGEALGDVLLLLRRHPAAREEYRAAMVDVPVDDAVASARLRRLIANTWVGDGHFEEADAAFDEAEAALGPIPEAEEAAPGGVPADTQARTEPELRRWREWMALQNDRMLARYWAFRNDELDALVGRMRPVVERWGSPAERSGFYQALVMTELRRYQYVLPAEVVEHAWLQLEASRELGSPDRLAWPWFFLGFACLWQGELAAAETHMGTALEIAERTGDLTTEARCVTYLALAARIRDDAGRVASLVGRCVDAVTRAAMPEYLGVAHGNEAWLAFRAGDLDAAERLASIAQASAAPPFRWTWIWPFVGAALGRGDLETAVGRARGLLAPDEQRTSDAIRVPLEAALREWDEGAAAAAGVRLEEAAAAARVTGRL